MRGCEDLSDRFRSLRLLIHGELIDIYSLVFVNASFNVPACKVATVCTGKRARSEAADGRTLPVSVVNVGCFEGSLARACISQRLSDGTFPCCRRNRVPGPHRRRQREHEKKNDLTTDPLLHTSSGKFSSPSRFKGRRPRVGTAL